MPEPRSRLQPVSQQPVGRRDFLQGCLGAALLIGNPITTACVSAGPAAHQPERRGLPKLLLPHPSGARVEIYLQGAHVASWMLPGGEEMLFLSRQSRLEPGAPIRGGIPVVFPQFAGLGPLPSHGLVRTLPWAVTESGVDDSGAVYALLQRTDDEATRALWPYSFRVELLVALGEDLTTTLRVTNSDARPFSFQTALHTYLRVGDIRQARVEGVEGLRYLDRAANGAERLESREPLRIRGQIDRVYVGAPDRLHVRDASRGRTIVVEKEGFADVVVWNPWSERARTLADLGDDEYAIMLCVEPANVVAPVRLEPGQVWSGTQRIRLE